MGQGPGRPGARRRSPAGLRARKLQDARVLHVPDDGNAPGMGADIGEPVPPDRVTVAVEAAKRLLEAVGHRLQRPLAFLGGAGTALVDGRPGQPVAPAYARNCLAASMKRGSSQTSDALAGVRREAMGRSWPLIPSMTRSS